MKLLARLRCERFSDRPTARNFRAEHLSVMYRTPGTVFPTHLYRAIPWLVAGIAEGLSAVLGTLMG